MPDRKTHYGVAALAGAGVGVYLARDQEGWPAIARIIGAVLGSVVGAALPDLIEPPLHSWHRRSFHSWGALAGSAGVSLTPPAAARQWLVAREAAVSRLRAQREVLPEGHPDRARVAVAEVFEQIVIGASIGLPVGYASHLILDACSPRGLPPL